MKTEKCLTTQLKYTEGYNDRLESARVEFNKIVQTYSQLPGFVEFQVGLEDIPIIDIKQKQRNLITDRLKGDINYVLGDAVTGRKSISDTLTELSEVNEGWGDICQDLKMRNIIIELERLKI